MLAPFLPMIMPAHSPRSIVTTGAGASPAPAGARTTTGLVLCVLATVVQPPPDGRPSDARFASAWRAACSARRPCQTRWGERASACGFRVGMTPSSSRTHAHATNTPLVRCIHPGTHQCRVARDHSGKGGNLPRSACFSAFFFCFSSCFASLAAAAVSTLGASTTGAAAFFAFFFFFFGFLAATSTSSTCRVGMHDGAESARAQHRAGGWAPAPGTGVRVGLLAQRAPAVRAPHVHGGASARRHHIQTAHVRAHSTLREAHLFRLRLRLRILCILGLLGLVRIVCSRLWLRARGRLQCGAGSRRMAAVRRAATPGRTLRACATPAVPAVHHQARWPTTARQPQTAELAVAMRERVLWRTFLAFLAFFLSFFPFFFAGSTTACEAPRQHSTPQMPGTRVNKKEKGRRIKPGPGTAAQGRWQPSPLWLRVRAGAGRVHLRTKPSGPSSSSLVVLLNSAMDTPVPTSASAAAPIAIICGQAVAVGCNSHCCVRDAMPQRLRG